MNHLDNYLLVRESTATRLDLMKKPIRQQLTSTMFGQANTLRALGDLGAADELKPKATMTAPAHL
ncbi:MAG: hypothetical protein R3E39_08965 [Anaerolineae bacterium]